MGFNSAFKGLNSSIFQKLAHHANSWYIPQVSLQYMNFEVYDLLKCDTT